ncbi:hypothetical protein BKA93DRAFT_870326 [Sparassis latifolia]
MLSQCENYSHPTAVSDLESNSTESLSAKHASSGPHWQQVDIIINGSQGPLFNDAFTRRLANGENRATRFEADNQRNVAGLQRRSADRQVMNREKSAYMRTAGSNPEDSEFPRAARKWRPCREGEDDHDTVYLLKALSPRWKRSGARSSRLARRAATGVWTRLPNVCPLAHEGNMGTRDAATTEDYSGRFHSAISTSLSFMDVFTWKGCRVAAAMASGRTAS